MNRLIPFVIVALASPLSARAEDTLGTKLAESKITRLFTKERDVAFERAVSQYNGHRLSKNYSTILVRKYRLSKADASAFLDMFGGQLPGFLLPAEIKKGQAWIGKAVSIAPNGEMMIYGKQFLWNASRTFIDNVHAFQDQLTGDQQSGWSNFLTPKAWAADFNLQVSALTLFLQISEVGKTGSVLSNLDRTIQTEEARCEKKSATEYLNSLHELGNTKLNSAFSIFNNQKEPANIETCDKIEEYAQKTTWAVPGVVIGLHGEVGTVSVPTEVPPALCGDIDKLKACIQAHLKENPSLAAKMANEGDSYRPSSVEEENGIVRVQDAK